MSDLHIDDFYKDSAKILIQLFKQFPRRENLWVDDIAGMDTPDEFGLHSERYQAGFSAMLWLAEQGWLDYVDMIQQPQLGLDQAVLSQSAFLALTASLPTPDDTPILNNNRINAIRGAVKAQSSSQIEQQIQALLQSR